MNENGEMLMINILPFFNPPESPARRDSFPITVFELRMQY